MNNKIAPITAVLSAVLALSVGKAAIKNSALVIGAISSSYAVYQYRPRKKTGLSEAEILELAITSASRQLEEYEQERIANIQHLYETWENDATAIELELELKAAEQEEKIASLNQQVNDLNELLDEQLAEIDQQQEQAKLKTKLEIDAYKAEVELQLKAQREALTSEAKNDEAWINQEEERLAAKFDEDKAILIAEYQQKEKDLLDRIEFLEQDLGAMQWQLRNFEKPILPEGVERENIAARRVIEVLAKLDCICDFKGAWVDQEFIYVRIRPRIGGLRQVTKWADRIMFELDLVEKPMAELVEGAIQLNLRPRAMLPLRDSESLSLISVTANQSTSGGHPEIVQEQAIASLNATYLADFVEPEKKCSISGQITQLEIDWVNWLWNFHSPRPIRSQKAVIFRIWGKKSGDGRGFLTAKGRLHRIALIAGIDLKRGG